MQNVGTLIAAAIRPNDSLDQIASAYSNEILGGVHSVVTLADRNSIYTVRRAWGMFAIVYNDGVNTGTYQLTYGHVDTNIANNANWKLFEAGGGGGTPVGPEGAIQYKTGSSFDGSDTFVFDFNTQTVSVGDQNSSFTFKARDAYAGVPSNGCFITFVSGDSDASGGNGGDVEFYAGIAAGIIDGDGGNVKFVPGSESGVGARGKIWFGDLTTGFFSKISASALSQSRDNDLPNSDGVFALSVNGNFADPAGNITLSLTSGTVTSFTFTDANGFTGSVLTATTTPTLSLGTSITGLLKGSGGAIIAAVAGSDYATLSNRLDEFAAPNTSVSFSSQLITNLLDPVSAQDAATKNYVDTIAQGLSAKAAARLATTAALPTVTYSNGSSGVGATLTASSVGILTVDGSAVVLNDRIVVKNQVAGLQNGIYACTTEGTAGVAFVLARVVDANVASELVGAFVFVQEGTANTATGWTIITSPITVGTTPIVFTQFSGAGTYTAGTGLTLTGTQFTTNANLSALDALASTGFISRTGTNTWAQRTLTGTANRITITNGTGVSGDPVFDIASTYIGQATITTLGTIATGVWSATAILTTRGGTGLTAWTQGDIPYYTSGTALTKLAKNTSASRYLSNQGASNAPSWNQVNLANGVTGLLPWANIVTPTSLDGSLIISGALNLAINVAHTNVWQIYQGNTETSHTPTVNGDVWLDSNQHAMAYSIGGYSASENSITEWPEGCIYSIYEAYSTDTSTDPNPSWWS